MTEQEPDFADSLEVAKRKLERLQRERDQLDLDVRKMEQLVAALRAVAEPDEEGAEVASLADTIRTILKATPRPMSAPEIRDRVLTMGFEDSRYSQLLATIHVILNRLAKSNEVTIFQSDSDGKQYWWTLNGAPRSWRVSIGPSAMTLQTILSSNPLQNLASETLDPKPSDGNQFTRSPLKHIKGRDTK